jgi:hypothetical protein
MFRFFKKKKKVKLVDARNAQKVPTKSFSYHPKIILAWAKAIDGEEKLLNYLNENGFKELVMATHALNLKDKARDWLMENGYAHVMAMINAAEGNEQALAWLKKNDYLVFYHMALAIDHQSELSIANPTGFYWLKKYATQDIFLLTEVIQRFKDAIEEDNSDIHIRR